MIAIRIRNLSRRFETPLGLDGADASSAWWSLSRILGIATKQSPRDSIHRSTVVTGMALQNISLDIEAGSAVCLVGASGAGKSVLLKTLAGAIPPTEGRIEITGAVNSLLGVSEDLDVRLTALENIENYSRLKRFPAHELDAYARDVVEFSELIGFESIPVRSYSTGMTMRLGMALALCGKPSVVLIDDVLGVGDIAFQQKCVTRLHQLRERRCTLVLALSDEDLVRQIATRVITLRSGRVVADNLPSQVARHRTGGETNVTWHIASYFPENDVVALRSVSVGDQWSANAEHLNITMTFETKVDNLDCRPLVILTLGKLVYFRSVYPRTLKMASRGRVTYSVAIPARILCAGVYKITISTVAICEGKVFSLKAHEIVSLEVEPTTADDPGEISSPLCTVELPWEIQPINTELSA